ncbi:MAG: hypothetical protein AAGA77_14955 [Bacteroidota bacterium]
MLNSIVYDADKYKDYKGTPYLWEENKEVIIFDRNAKEYNSVIGNYNGLDGEFEVYKNDRFIRLPPYLYIKIQVINDPAVNYTLYSNIHPKLKNKYCIQHAQSSNYRVFESFIAKESNTTIQKPGKPAEIKKIIPKSNYFILAGRALIQFKLNRKKLIKKFGHKKEIKRFLKENKIKINTIEDVLPLLEFLDSNGWLIP